MSGKVIVWGHHHAMNLEVRRHHLTRAATLLALSISTGAGCFRYVPVELSDVPIGGAVRTRLSQSAADRLGERLVRADLVLESQTLEGELVARETGTILIATRSTSAADPYGPSLRQRIVLAQQDVLAVDLKQLDRLRTAGLAAVVGAALAAIAIHALSGETGGSKRSLGDSPAEAGVPARRP